VYAFRDVIPEFGRGTLVSSVGCAGTHFGLNVPNPNRFDLLPKDSLISDHRCSLFSAHLSPKSNAKMKPHGIAAPTAVAGSEPPLEIPSSLQRISAAARAACRDPSLFLPYCRFASDSRRGSSFQKRYGAGANAESQWYSRSCRVDRVMRRAESMLRLYHGKQTGQSCGGAVAPLVHRGVTWLGAGPSPQGNSLLERLAPEVED